MRARAALFVFCLLLFVTAPLVRAQTQGGRITIRITPASPRPGEVITVTASDQYDDLDTADVRWRAGGMEFARGEGLTETSLRLDDSGTATEVAVAARLQDGTDLSSAIFVRPASISIVWETDSYTHPFYRGKAIPGPGSRVRAEAITRFVRDDGTVVPNTDIVYAWKQDGTPLAGGPGRGRNRVTVRTPLLFGPVRLSVTATSKDGAFSATTDRTITSSDTMLALYEEHPLFGTLYNNSISGLLSIQDTEITLAAVPYFAAAQSATDPSLAFVWSVDGKSLPNDPKEPDKITIGATEEGGRTLVGLTLSNKAVWTEAARGAWEIVLTTTDGAMNFFRPKASTTR